jgi:hypothetical protein
MKVLYLLLILSFCCLGCSNKDIKKEGVTPKAKKLPTKEVTVLSIKNPKLYPALDAVIDFEKKCPNYSDSLYFGLSVFDNQFSFETGNEFSLALALENLGCFKYREHFFFVSNTNDNSFFCDWFSYTDKKFSFPFDKYYEAYIDDSWPVTEFVYKNDRLKFKERYNACR